MKVIVIRSARRSGKGLIVSQEIEEYLKDKECILTTLEEFEKEYVKGLIEELDKSYSIYDEYSEPEEEIIRSFSHKLNLKKPNIRHQVINRKPKNLVKKIIR